MKAAVVARKSGIPMLILRLFATLDAEDLSSPPEYYNKKDDADQLKPEMSYCPLSSWFQKISNPSYECNKQKDDTNDGITIVSIKLFL